MKILEKISIELILQKLEHMEGIVVGFQRKSLTVSGDLIVYCPICQSQMSLWVYKIILIIAETAEHPRVPRVFS